MIDFVGFFPILSYRKYVKEEKAVREDIARMSSKSMSKVQEDVMALKQLLSVVANGLQRNTCSVEKLKQEMTQVRICEALQPLLVKTSLQFEGFV